LVAIQTFALQLGMMKQATCRESNHLNQPRSG
jgi:hypothetical protein